MGLVLKYVRRTKAGRWQYRRRVPKAVAEIISKLEFKGSLGDSEREALAAYPRFHAQVEKEIADAIQGGAQSVAADRGDLTERQAFEVALARAASLAPEGTRWIIRDAAAEAIAVQYPRDPETLDPIGATAVDRHTINLLRGGPAAPRGQPEYTLEDARTLYLKERRGVEPSEDMRRFEGQVNLVVGMVRAALGGRDPVLIELTREDARKVRDHMLDRIKSDGKRISPSSVRRYLNDLRAIINHAATESLLPGTFQNPFNNLPVGSTRGQSSEREKRDPLPPHILQGARKRILGAAGYPLPLIWRLLEGTGCRLAEITGLRVEDVDITGELPSLRVTWHEARRIKTNASRRYVPLVGDALEAAKEAVKLAEGHVLLFPTYGRARGSSAVSVALMKHLRAVTRDPKHVVHSLRHNMKDKLVLAEVSQLDQNLILGHALEGVGDRVYGGDAAKLRSTTRAMKRALGVT
ncbi:tyrosine-type recombinase/integrase [Phaeovulum sp.]|uniref:tyrosine-type recombinase/integrase n=1 Tax=Phaeovulum sp. TaxID=2934796 RepID=UPI0039E490EA